MILTTSAERRDLLARTHTVALVGASDNPHRPSYFVFRYLRSATAFTVAPITPRCTSIDGVATYETLAAYAAQNGPPDLVDVFRRPDVAPEVTREAIAAGARAIWFQYGVVNAEAIAIADAAGLDVVVDRCLKVEAARLNGGLATGGLNSGLITARRRAR